MCYSINVERVYSLTNVIKLNNKPKIEKTDLSVFKLNFDFSV